MANQHVPELSAFTNIAYEADELRQKDQQKSAAVKFGNDGDWAVKGQSHSDVDKEKTYVFTFRKILVVGIVIFGLFACVVALAVVLLVRGNSSNKTDPDEYQNECAPEAQKPPHIVFFLADDLGWHDVGYHNPEMLTPNMDRLATEGVIFNQTYSHPSCSPARSALMSGYYSFNTGMQHHVLQQLSPYGLPTNLTILPKALKPLGYSTHMIGKWHLGMCKEDYLPFNRGFDSFYGYLNNFIEYYDHTNQDAQGFFQEALGGEAGNFSAYDFWDNTGMILDNTTYISYLLNNKAEELIEKHNKDTPMFLYFASPLPHFFLTVPEEYENLYPNHKNRDRKIYNGMVSMMDEIIGNLTNKLMEKGMWENTLFVFMSDNGGTPGSAGFNFPLRGSKATLFEGGTRVVTFAAGGALKKMRYVNNGLMHITDWYPTFVSMAGGSPDPDMDGMSMRDFVLKGKMSPRDEIVYSIDEIIGGAAIRVGDWKLIEGNHQMFYPYVYAQDGWYFPPTEDNQTVVPPGWIGDSDEEPPPAADVLYLFNLKDDPTESHNLADSEPEIVAELQARLNYRRSRAVPAMHPPPDLSADPSKTGGIWRTGFC